MARRDPPLALAVLLSASLALAPAGARAAGEGAEDRALAQKEFAEAQKAFGAGDYRHAAEMFEAAYKHKPHHSSLWNAARARQRSGELVRAANLYARYLRVAPPAARDRNNALSSLRSLAMKLGQLEVTAVGLEEVRLDRELFEDKATYVTPGAHVIEAKVPGKERSVTQSVNVEAGQTVSVALVAPPDPPPPPPPTPVVVAQQPTDPVRPPVTPQPEQPHGLPPLVVWIGAGVTAAGAGFTVISGLDVINQKASFDKDPSQTNLDAGRSKQTRTNVALGGTVVVGLLTGVCAIWLVDWRKTDSSARIGLGPGEVLVKGTF